MRRPNMGGYAAVTLRDRELVRMLANRRQEP